MAKGKKSTGQGDKNIVAVEQALSKSERFIENNQNTIIWVVAIVVLIVGGYIGYNRFILEPREREATAEIYKAEQYFNQSKYNRALEGDGVHLGFLDIIDSYRRTKTANIARYYAGISLLRTGEFEEAIEHLQNYRKRDQLTGAMALGFIGDAYLELDDKTNALKYYIEAAEYKPNSLTTPMFLFKAAQLKEIKEDYEGAYNFYYKIKTKYHGSRESADIDYYLGRTSGLMK